VAAAARGRDVSVTGLSLDPNETEVYPPPTPSARPPPGTGPRRPAVEQTVAPAPELEAQPLAVDPTESGAPLIGIDLGGRWVRCALVHEGQVRGLPIDGNPYVPALVAVAPDGRTVVCGMQAMERSLEDPASAASIVELLRAMDDSPIAHPALRSAVGRAPDGRPVATVGGTTFATGDLLYAFFRRMEPSLTALLGQAPRVVMSVPHELSDAARELVADAARHAGLAVEVLVPEPLAILRAYRAAVQGMETVMTVDLGATHLGIAVARRGRDDFFVVESRWKAEVSAESIDAAVAELGMAELGWREHEVPLATRMELLRGAEQARTDLRRDPHVELPVTLADGPGEPARVHVLSIPRSRVYQATQTVTDQVIVAARAALATAGVHPKALGAVILSGSGGVYPPLVGALTTMMGREPLQTVPAAEAVLVGLAELAADRSQTGRAAKPDTLTAAIGIGLPGGRFRALVPAGTKLPTQLTRRQPTVRDAQTEVELTLYQGKSDVVNECEHLGTVAIRDLPRAARGQISVDVEVFVDADAVMAITLSEAYTGKRVQLTVATQQTASQRRAQLAQRPSLTDLSDPSRARGKKGFFNRLFGR
jgi:molecular chaperone DnaK